MVELRGPCGFKKFRVVALRAFPFFKVGVPRRSLDVDKVRVPLCRRCGRCGRGGVVVRGGCRSCRWLVVLAPSAPLEAQVAAGCCWAVGGGRPAAWCVLVFQSGIPSVPCGFALLDFVNVCSRAVVVFALEKILDFTRGYFLFLSLGGRGRAR